MKTITLNPKVFGLMQEVCAATKESPSECVENLIKIVGDVLEGMDGEEEDEE